MLLFGHPIHPMLVVIPLGLFIMSVIADFVYLSTGQPVFAFVSYWDIAVGVLGGLLAAVFGFLDWIAIPRNTRAKVIGAYHGLGNVVVVLLFAISWWMRYNADGHLPSTAATVLIVAGLVLGAVTGWLGGELVDRLGVGVDEGAHLDAPNSLRHHSARARAH
jgi:uncharacterized membrane protein